ncbi:MAG: hypothetical protein U0V74_08635 [Chitinophagales bacterium]
MEQQDDLFLLVKSLNKSEKKFFTQYVNLYEKGASPIYLQVFNFLNDEERYDEERLFKKFRDQKFRKNYPVTKHYLKNLIIKTMRHSELTVREDKDITVQVLDIKRLMAKGLLPMAKRMIEKLKEEAIQAEKLNDLLQLITMQRGLIAIGYYRHEPHITLDTLDAEEDLLIEKIKQLRQLMNANIKLHSMMHFEIDNVPAEVKREVEQLVKNNYLQNYDEMKSAKARHTFLEFWTLYYCALGDYKKYYEYAQKKLDFVRHEKLPPTVSNWLVIAYNHYMAASLLTGNFSEFEKNLTFLEQMHLHSHFHDADRFQTVSIYALLYYIRQGDEERIRRYIQYSKDGLENHAPFVHKSFVYSLRATIAYAYLRLKQYDDCLKEVNELLSVTHGETRRDYVGLVRIINLMLRYEMKELGYLANLLKSTYRFFVNYLYTSPVHQFAMSYMKDAIRLTDSRKRAELNATYREKLEQLRYNPAEADFIIVMMMTDYLRRSE